MHQNHSIVLVVDDPMFSNVLARSFGRRRYLVSVASDFNRLEATLSRTTPSHAVVDLSRQSGLGLRCVAALRAAHRDTVIVMLIGSASPRAIADAIRLGACCCVPKPCDSDDIEAAFAGVMSGSLWPAATPALS